jgi:Zn-dependent protease
MNVIVVVETFVTFIIAVTIHEAAHAAMAALLGDSTPVSEGRLSFSPRRQMAAVGTIVAIVYSVGLLGGIGWGKPVSIDARRLRAGPNFGMFLVALAGPAVNLVLGLAAAFGLRLLPGYYRLDVAASDCGVGIIPGAVAHVGLPLQACMSQVSQAQPGYLLRIDQFLFVFALTNFLIVLVNLIPLHPLDGYKILYALLPAEPAISLRRYEGYMEFALLVLFFVLPVVLSLFSIPFSPAGYLLLGARHIVENIASNVGVFFAWL